MKRYEFTITLRKAEPYDLGEGRKGFSVVYGQGAVLYQAQFEGTLAEAVNERFRVGRTHQAGSNVPVVGTISIPGGIRAPVGFKQITFYETFNF